MKDGCAKLCKIFWLTVASLENSPDLYYVKKEIIKTTVMKKYKVTLKGNKVWSKLFDSVIEAVKEFGPANILKLEEVQLIDLK